MKLIDLFTSFIKHYMCCEYKIHKNTNYNIDVGDYYNFIPDLHNTGPVDL